MNTTGAIDVKPGASQARAAQQQDYADGYRDGWYRLGNDYLRSDNYQRGYQQAVRNRED